MAIATADPTNVRRLSEERLRGAALVTLVVIAYLPGFTGGWLWDDNQLVTENPLVTSASNLWRIWFDNRSNDYFPVTLTSFWLEYRVWGDWAPGYRTVNILLHAANTVLVWRILVRLGVPGAWMAAAVWGIHPVTAASAAWVAERKNTLSMLFGCLSVLGWMSYEDTGERRFYGWSLASFVVALLAKTSLVTLPLILPVLSWWRHGRVTRVDLVRTVPFLVASFLLGLVTLWYQLTQTRSPGPGAVAALMASVPRGGVLAGRAVGFYLWKDLWPTNLAMVYGLWPLETSQSSAYLPTIVVAAAMAGLWWCRERRWARAGLFASTVFLLALLPILGFLPAAYIKTHACVADHWQYVALVAPAALAVTAGHEVIRGRRGQRVVAGAILTILGILTFRQAAIHRTAKGMWTHNLAIVDAWEAHLGMSLVLAQEGRKSEAIDEARRAVAGAPRAIMTNSNLTNLLMEERRYPEALQAYRAVLAIGGDRDVRIYRGAGLASALMGDLVAAERYFAAGAAIAPESLEILLDWGQALGELQRPREAVARYREALALRGDHPEVLNSLAYLLACHPGSTGDGDAAADAAEAVGLARRACAATGDEVPSFLDTLATALAAGGDFSAAVEVADRAVALAEEEGDGELAAEIRGHRDLFRSGRPFRPD